MLTSKLPFLKKIVQNLSQPMRTLLKLVMVLLSVHLATKNVLEQAPF